MTSNIQQTSKHYTLTKPTQIPGQEITIRQTTEGLKLYLNHQGKKTEIQKHLIQGLPKHTPLPQQFFENCCLRTKSAIETTLSLTLPLKGGMYGRNDRQNSQPGKHRNINPDNLVKQYSVLLPDERFVQELDLDACKFLHKGYKTYKIKGSYTPYQAFITELNKTQLVWKAIKKVNNIDTKDLAELCERFGSIHVNTSTHGSEDPATKGWNAYDLKGQGLASNEFLQEDLEVFNRIGNCSLQTISKYNPPIYPKEADFVIDAWCLSAHNFKTIEELLEKTNPLGNLQRLNLQEEEVKIDPRKPQVIQPQITIPQAQVALHDIAFGKAEWAKYFGDIGAEPSLPANIEQILNSQCIFWPGQQVKDTHLLVLVPNTVNGKPFNLNLLSEIIQSPKAGNKTQYRYYSDHVKNELGNKSFSSHWVLMTRDVIPNSRSKTYPEQKALIKGPYTVPGVLETATGILMHHVKGGERLYSESPNTYTRCLEQVLGNQYRVVVGSFGSSGLYVHYLSDDYRNDNRGLGGLRKF